MHLASRGLFFLVLAIPSLALGITSTNVCTAEEIVSAFQAEQEISSIYDDYEDMTLYKIVSPKKFADKWFLRIVRAEIFIDDSVVAEVPMFLENHGDKELTVLRLGDAFEGKAVVKFRYLVIPTGVQFDGEYCEFKIPVGT